MCVANLHTAPKRHLIKLELFLRKSILIWKNINSQDVWKGLDSTKFLEILHRNKTPDKFSNHQLKIAFKHPNSVREPFKIFLKIRTPPGFETLGFQNFFFYSTSQVPKQSMLIENFIL